MLILFGIIVLCIAAYYMLRSWFLILRSLLHGKRWDEEFKEWLSKDKRRLEENR